MESIEWGAIKMEKKLTMKTKKDEILKAYDELLAKHDEKKEDIDKIKVEETEVEVEKESKTATIEESPPYTIESVVKGVADLKLDLNKTLTDISDKLIEEVNKLESVKKEIVIETKNLEDIRNIQVNADTLNTLIQTHEGKKKAFEEETTSIREQWMKEQEEHEIAVKERDEKLKKGRDRELEEYTYNLLLTRKKDKNAYEEEKTALKKALSEERETKMKELLERETEIAAQEAEIEELKARVKTFPIELEKAVENAEETAIALIEKESKQEAELLAKEIEGEKRVYELKIENLEDTMMKQALQIEASTKQLNISSDQVLNIASKAIEGASGIKTLASVDKMALEQTKDVSTKK